MPRIKIDKDKCKSCELCISVCSRKCIEPSKKLNKRGARYVEFKHTEKCTGCAMCAIVCPDMCIEVYR